MPGPAIDPAPAWRWWAAAALIVSCVVTAYWNTLDNEFLRFDDRKYIYDHDLVTGDGGLKAIWADIFNDDFKRHYYPLTYTSFWIEHQLVGLGDPPNEVGDQPAHPLYHANQMALHALNAILVMLVLRALGVGFPIAALAGLVFAVHPVNVASVAWVSERKNVLSAAFFWLSLLVYVRHRRSPRIWLYLLSLALFQAGLFAKASILTLAPVVIVTDRVLDGRWTLISVVRSLPFFGLALVIAIITTVREKAIELGGDPTDVMLRPFIASAALVHYVQKMLLPVSQAIIYPRWAESLAEPRYWIAVVLVLAASGVIWRFRRWLGDLWLWGLALFLLTIGPVLGLKYFIWNQFAFVSDHYMYVPGVGVTLMVLLLASRLARVGVRDETPRWRIAAVTVVVMAVLLTLGWRTVRQNDTWQDNVVFWEHTVSVSPRSFVANMNLGNQYRRRQNWESALARYVACTEIDPTFSRTKHDAAVAARMLKRHDQSLALYRDAIETARRKGFDTWTFHTEYAAYLAELGRVDDAIAEFETILRQPLSEPRRQQAVRALGQLRRRR